MLCRNNETQELVAIKSIHKKRMRQWGKIHSVLCEKLILMKLRHPFIVSLRFTFQSPSKFYFGLEYVPGGDLFHHMKHQRFALSDIRMYTAEIAQALNHLHKAEIIYRDLKSENVMLDDEGHIKLTDFGLAKRLPGDSSTRTFCGTVEYLAPELAKHATYGTAVDWWALGILLYELTVGRTPFLDTTEEKVLRNILECQPSLPRSLDSGARALIQALLVKDPKKRAGFKQVKESGFLKDLNWGDVLARKLPPKFVPGSIIIWNVDQEYREEPAMDSMAEICGSMEKVPGFSYQDDDGLGTVGATYEEQTPIGNSGPKKSH
jgi:serine/threonine protein kinase